MKTNIVTTTTQSYSDKVLGKIARLFQLLTILQNMKNATRL